MNIRNLASIGLLGALLSTGCAYYQVEDYTKSANFLTIKHPYTDKDLAEARAEAKKLCGDKKQVALQTEKVCSLSTCSTTFQCEDSANVMQFGEQADVVR